MRYVNKLTTDKLLIKSGYTRKYNQVANFPTSTYAIKSLIASKSMIHLQLNRK